MRITSQAILIKNMNPIKDNKEKINKPERLNTEEVLNQLAHRYKKEGEENRKVKKEYEIIDYKGKVIKRFWDIQARNNYIMEHDLGNRLTLPKN